MTQSKSASKSASKSGSKAKTWLRRLSIVLLAVLLLSVAGGIVFVNLMSDSFEALSDKKITNIFAEAGLPRPYADSFSASPLYPGETEFLLYYYSTEPLEQYPQKPILYLLHGAPGGAANFLKQNYFLNPSLRSRFTMIAMDRPGYGKSDRGRAVASFQPAIQPLLEQLLAIQQDYPGRQVYGLGWSFGGPLLALLAEQASNNPELLVSGHRILNGAIIVASPADPQQEKFWWFNPLLESDFINWMFSPSVRVANVEKMAHPRELEKMRQVWAKIRIPTAYLQGTADTIVRPANITFLAEQAKLAGENSHIYEIQGGGHEILFTEVGLIQNILTKWLAAN